MIIFSTSQYGYLRDELIAKAGASVGRCERQPFADGEVYHQILDCVAGERVVLVGGTISDSESLELFDFACGLVQEGVRSLTLVVPYLGYATMDRAIKPGEIVKAKTRARLLSSIPHAREANRVVLLDLHSEGLQYYFEGGLNAMHVYGKPIVLEAIRELGGERFVIGCTDAGRAKWVQSLANELGLPASFVFKQRLHDGSPVVTAVSTVVQDCPVVIYDDMIRSGASLLNAARAYLDAGASSVQCVTTHGVFPGDALLRIRESGLVKRIISTNSHPRSRELESVFRPYLALKSVADLLVPTFPDREEPSP
jgi:ribose-phosphate pyrophosphokinase